MQNIIPHINKRPCSYHRFNVSPFFTNPGMAYHTILIISTFNAVKTLSFPLRKCVIVKNYTGFRVRMVCHEDDNMFILVRFGLHVHI